MRLFASVLLLAALSTPAFAQGGRGGRTKMDRDGGPVAGDPAPDFNLKSIDGTFSLKLSSLRDKRPVVLLFGSYT